jgi:hypothetical protein
VFPNTQPHRNDTTTYDVAVNPDRSDDEFVMGDVWAFDDETVHDGLLAATQPCGVDPELTD